MKIGARSAPSSATAEVSDLHLQAVKLGALTGSNPYPLGGIGQTARDRVAEPKDLIEGAEQCAERIAERLSRLLAGRTNVLKFTVKVVDIGGNVP